MRRVLLILVLLIGCTGQNSHDYFGTNFLGAQYLDNPLGEGVAPDNDPLIRFDAFDCATFVETVLAQNNVNKLNKIRYKNGQPNFLTRNHFIETDWLKNNAKMIHNISSQYAATKTRYVLIDKKNWFKIVYNIDTDFVPQSAELEYIPYENAHNIHVSKPVIVLFIIDSKKIRNKIGTDLAVRHMGFLMPNGILRHASRRRGMVIDENFEKYITQIMENKNNLGIMLLDIKQ